MFECSDSPAPTVVLVGVWLFVFGKSTVGFDDIVVVVISVVFIGVVVIGGIVFIYDGWLVAVGVVVGISVNTLESMIYELVM